MVWWWPPFRVTRCSTPIHTSPFADSNRTIKRDRPGSTQLPCGSVIRRGLVQLAGDKTPCRHWVRNAERAATFPERPIAALTGTNISTHRITSQRLALFASTGSLASFYTVGDERSPRSRSPKGPSKRPNQLKRRCETLKSRYGVSYSCLRTSDGIPCFTGLGSVLHVAWAHNHRRFGNTCLLLTPLLKVQQYTSRKSKRFFRKVDMYQTTRRHIPAARPS